jgi:uncharacterized protein (DUF362 family)
MSTSIDRHLKKKYDVSKQVHKKCPVTSKVTEADFVISECCLLTTLS